MANFTKILGLSTTALALFGLTTNGIADQALPNYANHYYQSQDSTKLDKLGQTHDDSDSYDNDYSDAAATSNANNNSHDGFYLGLGAGVVYQSTSSPASSDNGVTFNSFSDDDILPSYNGYLGYDFHNVPIRLELSYSYIGTNDFKASPLFPGNQYQQRNSTGAFKLHSQVALANMYYVFRHDSTIRPYVGGGMGVAWNTLKSDTVVGQNPLVWHSGTHTNTTTQFAWDAVAGINFAFNQHWGLDVDLRYMGLGDSEGKYTNSTGGTNNVHINDLANLSANVAVIYQF